MNNKAIARTKTIYNLLRKYKSDEDLSNLLSRGFIPENIENEYNILFQNYLEETKNEIDTDYDMSLFSNYFYLNDKKIVGEEKKGSGYINPVKTIGDINKINNYMEIDDNLEINTESEIFNSIKEINKWQFHNSKTGYMEWKEGTPESVKKLAEEEQEKISKSLNLDILENDISEQKRESKSITDLSIINRVKSSSSKQKQKNENNLFTIEESLKLYSSNISEPEIKGHVWYKQRFGTPMYGWEKYFISEQSSLKGDFCVTTKPAQLKNQQFQNIRLVPTGTTIGIKTRFSNEYSDVLYWVIKSEKGELFYVSENDFEVKKSIATVDEKKLDELVLQKGLCFDGEEYVPVYMFAYGNIFEIKDKFYGKFNSETNEYENSSKEKIKDKFGVEIANWHESLIKNAESKLNLLDFSNPIVSERPYLSKENTLSSEFMINELNLDSGVSIKKYYDDIDYNKRRGNKRNYSENDSIELFEAYKIWFEMIVTDTMVNNTTVSDIKSYYFSNKGVSIDIKEGQRKKDIDKEKDEIKINARLEGERFYSEFLATALQKNDLLALNRAFNKDYNNIISIDASKIPVGFVANKEIFNNSNFRLKPVQRDGLAFMNINNCGVMAYDVGFGKTLCAIHNLASLLQNGQIKRPIIAVPKQVYKNWIYEMFGYWTNGEDRSETEFEDSYFVNGALTGTKYKLNKWFNLGSGYEQKNKLVDEYTITLVTYQGLVKIGFSEKLYGELAEDIFNITNTKFDEKEQITDRQLEKQKEKAEGMLGKALSKTDLDIDVLGFDYMVLDEAHNFKNIFSSVYIPKGEKNAWRLPNGTMSSRGIKAFVLSLYLQKKYNGSVNLLTATPFTNSVLEIFSMFSLVSYNYLESSKINNVFKFLSMFIETQVEYTVDATNKIELNTVIKSFKNKNILRDLLYKFFDYQDDPKLAGVKRPCKINFPNKNTTTLLQMSEKQEEIQIDVQEEALNYSPENKGAVGRALAWAKSNAFSPYSSTAPSNNGFEDLDEFISQSPKIDYTIRCIKSIKDWHESKGQEMSGQVIYSNRGKELFSTFKNAIERECGFEKKLKFGEDTVDEVEIITGSGSDSEVERKEVIKDAFNQGIVKVIIGTATIQEGINLQKRGTCLYNLDLDWNPTSFKQLEGRIHRQGNLFKYVRVVVPMIQGTLDSFINQKLDEKSKRIADIWDKDNNENSVSVTDAVDPMELKFNLIKDENELIKMRYDIEFKRQNKVLEVSKNKYDAFEKLENAVSNFNSNLEEIENNISKIKKEYQLFYDFLNKFETESFDKKIQNKSQIEAYDRLKQRVLKVINSVNDFYKTRDYKLVSELKRLISYNYSIDIKRDSFSEMTISYSNLKKKYDGDNYSWLPNFSSWTYERFMGAFSECKRIENNILKPFGVKFTDDVTGIKDVFLKEKQDAEKVLEFLKSEEYKNQIIYEIRLEIEKRQKQIGSIQDRVDDFMKTNYLLSYPFVESEADNCDIPNLENDTDSSYIKEELKVDEYLEFDDISKKTTAKKLSKIQDFMNPAQLSIVRSSNEFNEVINRLYKIIAQTPEIYASDDIPLNKKVAYLHYFYGGSDWYIVELDKKDILDDNLTIEESAFGYAILNGDLEMSEFGYIDINELKRNNVELDFYFEPKKLSELFPSKFKSSIEPIEPPKPELSKKEIIEKKLKGLNVAFKYADKDKKAIIEKKIKGLKVALKYSN